MKIIVIDTDEYIAEKKVKEERKKICETCDKNKMGVCSECYCIILSKTAYKNSTCPLGKW